MRLHSQKDNNMASHISQEEKYFSLLARGKASKEVFAGIFELYGSKLLKHCLVRVASPEDAQDITAEAFTRTWDYVKDGRKVNNFRAFLYRVAHNLIVDYFRKRTHTVSLDSLTAEGFEPEGQHRAPDEEVAILLAAERARNAMKLLPQREHAIITMRYLDGLSVSEISRVMDMEPNHVSVTIHRGIARLRKILGESFA